MVGVEPVKALKREREQALFAAMVPDAGGRIRCADLLRKVAACGLADDDPRWRRARAELSAKADALIDFEEFRRVVGPNMVLVERVVAGELIIPDFDRFGADLAAMVERARDNRAGAVATYIPPLAEVDPELFGFALCTVDGQRLAIGDARAPFTVQSACKPINYCIALEECGEQVVHQHIGREPSGHGYNELRLDDESKPHNPMINAGAIMACALIGRGRPAAARFDSVMKRWRSLTGGEELSFSEEVFEAEKNAGDRNYALGYLMREHDVFPEGAELLDVLEFYFQCCSIEANADQLSVVAATLANGGVVPQTGERVFRASTVRRCLSLMSSCGMYDFSGEFAFSVGLPAKSGVSGAIISVVPNVMGFCSYSPRLDEHGNSERGLQMCRRLVERYNFHVYDSLFLSGKNDPRRMAEQARLEAAGQLLWGACVGDVGAMQGLVSRGISPNCSNYDGRTPLHIAAAEGRAEAVRYLLSVGGDPEALDRWGHAPIDDARREGNDAIIAMLEPR